MNMKKTYSELMALSTFEERFEYLKMSGSVGEDTFGFDRYLNQRFYRTPEWKHIRNEVILRDDGCDLGICDRPIHGRIYVHHLNPITKQDVLDKNDDILNPEYLICVSELTHKAIHYSNVDALPKDWVERKPNDTKLW